MRYLAIAVLLAFSSAAQAQPIHLLTEEYPPFSYREGDKLLGISVDQVKSIMEAAKLEYTMEMQPWARAFSLAESTQDTCVFTTGLLPERMARFKWVQPLVLDLMILVRKAGQPFAPTTIDEAKRFTVGVHKDDSAETYAKQQGFPRLDSAPSLDLSLKKLLSGRIDLMIMTRTTYESLHRQGQPIEAALNLEGTRAGIACNLKVPDSTIAKMQLELDKLITNGTQAEIYKHYGQAGK